MIKKIILITLTYKVNVLLIVTSGEAILTVEGLCNAGFNRLK